MKDKCLICGAGVSGGIFVSTRHRIISVSKRGVRFIEKGHQNTPADTF